MALTDLYLERWETSDEGTFGVLKDSEGDILFYTGELPRYAGDAGVENERQTDCIPDGTYEAAVKDSPKFGRVYQLKDVPNRSGILIHSGNFCGDVAKGFKSHVLGCIILGSARGTLDGQQAVTGSKDAMKKFMNMMEGEPFTLHISWS